MTRDAISRSLLQALLELQRTDEEALRSALAWLDEGRVGLRTLVAQQNLAESQASLQRALKKGVG